MARISSANVEVRILNIICAYMRLRDADHRNLPHDKISVRTLIRSYGYSESYASLKWKLWDSTLQSLFSWVTKERSRFGVTPSKERLIGFVTRRVLS